MLINLYAAWIGLLLGCIAGAVPGLFFHRPDWLGGYAAWARRLLRLGHISFFGLGFINLALALSAQALHLETGLAWPSRLLLLGAVTMPLVCYLSAFKPFFRNLFFIPAGSVALGVGLFLWRMLAS